MNFKPASLIVIPDMPSVASAGAAAKSRVQSTSIAETNFFVI